MAELFGENICMPFFMSQTFHNIWMTMSGFGISLFRFTCMWDNLLIFEKEKLNTLMKGIFVGEIVFTSGLLSLSKFIICTGILKSSLKENIYFLATFGVYLSQKAMALDFCHGYGQGLVSTIHKYSKLDEETAYLGKTMVQISSLLTGIFIPATICLYGFIFWRLFKTNKINKLGKQQ